MGDAMDFNLPGQRRTDKSSYPQLYDAHHRTYLEDIPFWLRLARQKGDPILELGCGTGRVLIQLSEQGYRCYGLDRDPEMLAYLQKRCPQTIAGKLNLFLAEITSFNLEIQFPLILLPCNTFSTLEPSDRRSALECIARHLSPEGTFAASIPNPVILNQLPTNDQAEIDSVVPNPDTGNPVQISYWIERGERQVHFHWLYDHLYPDGSVERLRKTTSHYYASAAEYREELIFAGYTHIKTFGSFNQEPYNQYSPYMIFIAQF
jgi:SAM-dependent methyltransferase